MKLARCCVVRLLVAFACGLLLFGCGGSGGGAGSSNSPGGSGGSGGQAGAAGSLSFTIKWPSLRGRVVPIDCESIVATVTNSSGTKVATQTVARPSNNAASTVTIASLAPGSDTLTLSAYPTTNGTGTVQATGSVPATIVANQTSQQSVTMADTIARVAVTPAGPVVTVSNTASLALTAYDSANDVVLTSPTTIAWNSANTAVATISSTGVLTGVSAGTSLITATDTESGISGTTTATVNPTNSSGGSLSFIIKWPSSRARVVPVDCESVIASVTNSSGTQLATQTITRPTDSAPTTVTFTNLQPGSDTLTATAYPAYNGTGVAQATGSVPATIVANQTDQVTVTMADTIAKIVVGPADPIVLVGGTVGFTMTAYDAANEVVMTSPTTITWSSTNTSVATISSSGVLTGVGAGTTVVVATETESGINGTTSAAISPVQAVNTVVDRSGKYAYAISQNGSVYEYSIGSSGQLTSLSPSYVSTGYYASGYNSAPDGYSAYVDSNNNLYVLEQTTPYSGNPNTVVALVMCQFSIQANGQLQPLSPASISLGLSAYTGNLFVDPSGTFLYDTDWVFKMSSAGLTLLPNNIYPPISYNAVPIAGTSYIVLSSASGLTTYQVQSDGSMTSVFTLAATEAAVCLFASPTGAYVYAIGNHDGFIHCFGVHSDGSLTDNGVAYNRGIYWELGTFVENSTGTLMVQREAGTINSYTVQPDGTFDLVSSINRPPSSNAFYLPLAITPNGSYVYSPESTDVGEFSLSPSGVLTFLGTTN